MAGRKTEMLRLLAVAGSVLLAIALNSCGRTRAHGQWAREPTERQDAFFDLRFVNERLGFLVGWDGMTQGGIQGWNVLVSENGGLTWKPLPGQMESKIRKVFFITPRSGWALSVENDLLRSEDGGLTWALQRRAGVVKSRNEALPQKLVEVPEPLDHLLFVDDKFGWAWGGGRQQTGFSLPGVLLRTSDGGTSWQPLGYPFGNELTGLQFVDSAHGWACELKGDCLKSDDGGRSWAKMSTREGFAANALFFCDTEHGWILGNGGYALRTSDGGRSWEYRRTGHGKDLRDAYFLTPREGWMVGNGGTILYTNNRGNDWRRFESAVTSDLTHVQFRNPKLGWAAGNNGVLLRYSE